MSGFTNNPDDPFGLLNKASNGHSGTPAPSDDSGSYGAPPSAGGPTDSTSGQAGDVTSAGGWDFILVPKKDIFGKDIPGQFEKKLLGRSAKDTAAGQGGSNRNDALTAAVDALNGYLSASNAAEARRNDAFNQFQKLSEFALPSGATTAPGFEAGGPAQAFAGAIGLPTYKAPPIQTAQVDPSMLGGEPALSPAVQAMLGAINGAGNNAAAQAAAVKG